MVVLFALPTFVALAFGDGHPLSVETARALPIWVVPIAVVFLLFTIRAAGQGSGLLTWKDAEQRAPWGAMFLVGGGILTHALHWAPSNTALALLTDLAVGAAAGL